MGSLQRFAKAVVEGDAEDVTVYRRPGSEIVVVGKFDRWDGSVGAWQEALTLALADWWDGTVGAWQKALTLAQMTRLGHNFLVQTKTSTIEPMLKSYIAKPVPSPVRQQLGNVRRSIRDIEEGTGDREWHLASLSQEIHDVLASNGLAPEARTWVESMRRKYLPSDAPSSE